MAEGTEVKFVQPKKGVQVYRSQDESLGFEVSINGDKRSWTVKKGEEVLATDFVSRQEAMEGVSRLVNGGELKVAASTSSGGNTSAPKEKAPAQPKDPKQITAREQMVLAAIQAGGGSAQSVAQIAETSKLDAPSVYNVLGNVARRKLIALTGEGATLTDIGTQALASYNPAEAKARAPKLARNQEEIDAAREKYLSEKYGPKPEGIGPRPTREEWFEAAIANAQATLDFQKVDQRLHAYSPIAAKKVKNAQERLDIWKQKYEEYKAGGQAEAPAEPAPTE